MLINEFLIEVDFKKNYRISFEQPRPLKFKTKFLATLNINAIPLTEL